MTWRRAVRVRQAALAEAAHIERLIELLDQFADAWNRHDVDALMPFMASDPVFESSSGAELLDVRGTCVGQQ